MFEETFQAPKPCGIGSVLIGLFATLELLYILATNALQPVPRTALFPRTESEFVVYKDRERGPKNTLERSIDGLGFLTDRWGEATGAVQGWAMFAPFFATFTSHPVVQLLDAQGVVVDEYTPAHIPADPANYYSASLIHDRVRYYEVAMAMTHNCDISKSPQKYPEEVRDFYRERVISRNRSMHAFMRYHYLQYKGNAHIETVLLNLRLYPTPPPGKTNADREPPSDLRLARWVVNSTPEPGCLLIEFFDPAEGAYVKLKEEKQR